MNDRTKEWATKVCRYNWHSALSMGWPFPLLKYKYIFQIKHTEAITSNTTRKLLWFEITKMPIAVKNKFIVSFNIIFRTLSFPVIRVSERLCRNSEWAGSGKRKQTGVFRSNFFTPWRRKFYARSEALRGSRKCRFFRGRVFFDRNTSVSVTTRGYTPTCWPYYSWHARTDTRQLWHRCVYNYTICDRVTLADREQLETCSTTLRTSGSEATIGVKRRPTVCGSMVLPSAASCRSSTWCAVFVSMPE